MEGTQTPLSVETPQTPARVTGSGDILGTPVADLDAHAEAPYSAAMSARILVVDDEAPVRQLVRKALEKQGYDVVDMASVDEASAYLRGESALDVLLTDIRVGDGDGLELCTLSTEVRPDVPVVVMTGHTTLDSAIGALRSGAYDYLVKPLALEPLNAALRRAVEHRSLTSELTRLRREVAASGDALGIIGKSAAMKETFELISRVADSNATVLVTGESGTGKELVARAIHERSGRRGRFLAVNCAAMPPNLLESELFGHVRGAFTDAKRSRDGLFVEADGGTLFLDEIGELDLEMQPKLLRAIQERQVRPVGSSQSVSFDTRIVAATNRDLEADVKKGKFREDLYYRVHVINVHLPPLRSRGHDVLRLAQHFIRRFAADSGRPVRGLTEPAAEQLLEYDWPGNVRELQNCVERAVALARHDQLTVEDLPRAVREAKSRRALVDTEDPDEMPTLEKLERRYVHKVLDAVGGNKARASRVLGIDRRTLYRKLERWGDDD